VRHPRLQAAIHGDLRVAHFFATHAMHFVPLIALASVKTFGRDALAPVHIIGFAYASLIAVIFIQALMGVPFLAK